MTTCKACQDATLLLLLSVCIRPPVQLHSQVAGSEVPAELLVRLRSPDYEVRYQALLPLSRQRLKNPPRALTQALTWASREAQAIFDENDRRVGAGHPRVYYHDTPFSAWVNLLDYTLGQIEDPVVLPTLCLGVSSQDISMALTRFGELSAGCLLRTAGDFSASPFRISEALHILARMIRLPPSRYPLSPSSRAAIREVAWKRLFLPGNIAAVNMAAEIAVALDDQELIDRAKELINDKQALQFFDAPPDFPSSSVRTLLIMTLERGYARK